MDEDALRSLLDAVGDGSVPPGEAADRLRRLPYADIGFARVDHHRRLRTGLPEAVYGPGKTADECVAIVGELLDGGDGPVILTRADDAQRDAVLAAHPGGTSIGRRHHLVTWRPAPPRSATVVVASAGTADRPVADECAAALTALGLPPVRLADVGVAGLHRLLPEVERLATADAVVVVAGMEGALASVIGGVTGAPVVAVPTSVGYGASLEGVTALLAMLASCSPGVVAVGIDNGFGAACAVVRLLAPVAARA